MKAMLIAMVLIGSIAHAENPEKYMSFGTSIRTTNLSGLWQSTTPNSSFSIQDGSEFKMTDVLFDVRGPIGENFVLTFGGGATILDMKGRDNTVTAVGGSLYEINTPTTQALSGYTAFAELRYYLK